MESVIPGDGQFPDWDEAELERVAMYRQERGCQFPDWDSAEWGARVTKAKNMEEVLELMKEIPQDDISSMLTDDPMSTFTALQMMSKRSSLG